MTDDRGLYLGMRGSGWRQKPVWYGRREWHMCLFGPTGSGKSHIIIPNLATLRRSILVLDPKGEAAAVTAERRREFSDVHVLNAFGELVGDRPDLKSRGFNPLLGVDPESDTFIEQTRAIAETQVIANPDAKEPHWDSSGCELFQLLVMFECTHKEPSLVNVREMLGLPYQLKDRFWDDAGTGVSAPGKAGREQPEKRTIRGCESLMDIFKKAEGSRWPELRSKAQRFMEGGTELLGVLATARAQTKSLDSKLLRADLSTQQPFRFEQLKEKLTTVYVILPADEMEIEKQGRWLRLVVGSALRAMLKSPPSESVGRVLFLLDEAAAMGHFQPIESAMGYLRGYGCQLFSVWQDLPQLKRHYEAGWESFISASALMAYAPQEMTTAKYLSAHFGLKNEEVPSFSEDRETQEWRPSLGMQGFPLIQPQGLIGMEDRKLVVSIPHVSGPFFTLGVDYTRTPFFNEGGRPLRPNPYYKGGR